jgi:nicotinamidase-related amidase
VATARLIGWVISGVALSICVATTVMAYIETRYMKAQLKQEIRKLEQKAKDKTC